uniref:MHC class I-like antigen recognition-like domain-containing protein n=1 Tax=Cyprinodon variegatus TaxID=28743 RepID=A0A3Q2FTU2_CYPVA
TSHINQSEKLSWVLAVRETSLMIQITMITPLKHFNLKFVIVGLVDDAQMMYYDSNTQKAVPKQDWMEKNNDEQYWEGNTRIFQRHQQAFKVNIETVKQRFNQTGGFCVARLMRHPPPPSSHPLD